MNKQEAAEFLGVSERTVASYAASGRLSVRYVKGKTRDVADYDEAELAHLRSFPNAEAVNRETVNRADNHETAMAIPPPSPFRKPNTETVNRETVNFMVMTDEQFAGLTKAGDVPITQKTLLTFAEAAQFSGISEKLLRDAARAGKLKARKIGRAQRLRRTDLDAWIDQQFEEIR